MREGQVHSGGGVCGEAEGGCGECEWYSRKKKKKKKEKRKKKKKKKEKSRQHQVYNRGRGTVWRAGSAAPRKSDLHEKVETIFIQ
jgi:hypothetical protein